MSEKNHLLRREIQGDRIWGNNTVFKSLKIKVGRNAGSQKRVLQMKSGGGGMTSRESMVTKKQFQQQNYEFYRPIY